MVESDPFVSERTVWVLITLSTVAVIVIILAYFIMKFAGVKLL